jgi:hypothetical protein
MIGAGESMKKALAVFGVVTVTGLISSSSLALPVTQPRLVAAPSHAVQARVVCDETGLCVSPPTRRPTARWIYGDRSFYGPYDGPRYYGFPNRRYGWWTFGLW